MGSKCLSKNTNDPITNDFIFDIIFLPTSHVKWGHIFTSILYILPIPVPTNSGFTRPTFTLTLGFYVPHIPVTSRIHAKFVICCVVTADSQPKNINPVSPGVETTQDSLYNNNTFKMSKPSFTFNTISNVE